MTKRRAQDSSFGDLSGKAPRHRRRLSGTICFEGLQSDECEIVNVTMSSKSSAHRHNLDTSLEANPYDVKIPRLPLEGNPAHQGVYEDAQPRPWSFLNMTSEQNIMTTEVENELENRVERTGVDKRTIGADDEQHCEGARSDKSNETNSITAEPANIDRPVTAYDVENEPGRRVSEPAIGDGIDDSVRSNAPMHGREDKVAQNVRGTLQSNIAYPIIASQPLVSLDAKSLNNPTVESYPWNDPHFLSLVNYNLYQMQVMDSMLKDTKSVTLNHPRDVKQHASSGTPLTPIQGNNPNTMKRVNLAPHTSCDNKSELQPSTLAIPKNLSEVPPTQLGKKSRDYVSELYRLRQLGKIENIHTNFAGQNTTWTCDIRCDVKNELQGKIEIDASAGGTSQKKAKRAACKTLLQKI